MLSSDIKPVCEKSYYWGKRRHELNEEFKSKNELNGRQEADSDGKSGMSITNRSIDNKQMVAKRQTANVPPLKGLTTEKGDF